MMSHHPNIASVKKWRLDSSGKYIDSFDYELLRETDQAKQYSMAKEAFQKNYGCRIMGSFTVKEVPGNFHISSHAYQNIFVRLLMDGVIQTLDVSHKIHSLYFGDSWSIDEIQKYHKESQLLSLNGHQRIYNMTNKRSYTSHYHLDIVPTQYSDRLFRAETYQYTYNHNSYEVEHMPSLYFNYHIGGLQVNIYPSQFRIAGFLIQMFAIIGGIYSLASFFDKMIYQIWG